MSFEAEEDILEMDVSGVLYEECSEELDVTAQAAAAAPELVVAPAPLLPAAQAPADAVIPAGAPEAARAPAAPVAADAAPARRASQPACVAVQAPAARAEVKAVPHWRLPLPAPLPLSPQPIRSEQRAAGAAAAKIADRLFSRAAAATAANQKAERYHVTTVDFCLRLRLLGARRTCRCNKGCEWISNGKMSKKDLDVRLALAVGEYPILWDVGSELYKRADLKPQAWTKVVEKIGPPATVEWASKRWKSVKDTFNDNYRKVRESKRSGALTDDVFKPSWHLYQHLTYLTSTCAQAKSTSNLDVMLSASTPQQNVAASDVTNQMYFDTSMKKWYVIPTDSQNGVVADKNVSIMLDSTQPSEVESNNSSIDDLFPGFDSPEARSTPGSSSSLVCLGPSSASPIAAPSSTCMLPPSRPSSCPPHGQNSKRPTENDDHFFNKKGSSKRSSNVLLQKAVQAMEKIASEPPAPTPAPVTIPPEVIQDRFANFVAERLKGMDETTRKHCENDILKILMNY